MAMIEIWKDIPEYEGIYQISNFGNLKSLDRNTITKINKLKKIKGRVLTIKKTKHGYNASQLFKNGVFTTKRIHILVGLCFVHNPNPKLFIEINHIDKNRMNNHFSNLEWVSKRENSCHRSNDLKSTSKYIGVSYDTRSKKWISSITVNSKFVYIGSFKCQLPAYVARKNYEIKNKIINRYS